MTWINVEDLESDVHYRPFYSPDIAPTDNYFLQNLDNFSYERKKISNDTIRQGFQDYIHSKLSGISAPSRARWRTKMCGVLTT